MSTIDCVCLEPLGNRLHQLESFLLDFVLLDSLCVYPASKTQLLVVAVGLAVCGNVIYLGGGVR